MNQLDPSPSANTALERVLSEIYLRLRQGKFAEAKERLAKAKDLAPDSQAVLEIEGDLALAQRSYQMAQERYQQALRLDPTNTKLEEKFARALLKVHEPEYATLANYDESLWSNRVPRPAITSALQSALLPGLGQIYNGDLVKGVIMLCTAILLDLAELRHICDLTYFSEKLHTVFSFSSALSSLFSGLHLFLTLVLLGLWGYSIVDAWLVAKATR